ncbi:MAG: hypothetical protein J7524_15840 [Roseofilum sp. Belize BBD 4]|uniref:hypothetical protein n=1 Tax=Roseofilum sp. Belize BBD 4 TaxID=2821500 RepID=UPI001B1E4596|nr:hypothetical protein [Roseofilum sp. Belize BBD 4]MBP0034619.1 hypothetical protein [Roseofilum sp. Belize BBD 4]
MGKTLGHGDAETSFLIPHSPFPIPHSPFPIPHSPFPIPYSQNFFPISLTNPKIHVIIDIGLIKGL